MDTPGNVLSTTEALLDRRGTSQPTVISVRYEENRATQIITPSGNFSICFLCVLCVSRLGVAWHGHGTVWAWPGADMTTAVGVSLSHP